MLSLKKSKKKSRVRKSSLPVTGKAGEKVGRSEMLTSKRPGIGLRSLMLTGTSRQECSADLWPLRMTLISLLGAKGYVKLITAGRSLPFSPEFTYAFFSELSAIRRRVSSYSKKKRCRSGKKTDGYSMSRSFGKHSKEAIESAKYL